GWRGSKAGRCSARSSSRFDAPPRAPSMTASRAHRAGQQVKAACDATLRPLAVGMLRAIRTTSRTGMSDFAGGFMRRLGPRLKEHEIGRDNLAAAFSAKTLD